MNNLIRIQHTLSPTQKQDLLSMWNSEFPASISFQDETQLEQYLSKLKNKTYYTIDNQGSMTAWLCTLEREGVPWFIIIVKKNAQGKGHGKCLIERAMQNNNILRGWIVAHNDYHRSDGSSYPTPSQFYTKLGFIIQPEITITKGGITSTRIEWRQ